LDLSAVRKLGIYGGAFDPPHLAHTALAQSAIAQYQLDRLLILPTGHAWHKNRALSPAIHRITMAKFAFADSPQTRVDERETLRSGATYTIDTLHELNAEYPQAQLFLLMGQDQLSFFPQWHCYTEILKIATLLVAHRADPVPGTAQKDFQNQDKIGHCPIKMPALPISATRIRQLCSNSQAIDHLVNPTVARYIAEHRLYLSS
jgi:nicotinate-nucleotide adenylyltransferase